MRLFRITLMLLVALSLVASGCGEEPTTRDPGLINNDTSNNEEPDAGRDDTGPDDVDTDTTSNNDQPDVGPDADDVVEVTEGVMHGTWTVSFKESDELVATLTIAHAGQDNTITGTFEMPTGETGDLATSRWFEDTEEFNTSWKPYVEDDFNETYQVNQAKFVEDGKLEGNFVSLEHGFQNPIVMQRQ